MRHLAEHYDKSPDLLSPEDLRQYCIYLKEHKKVARQTSTQAICAIKIFWEKTLRRVWPHEMQLVRANPQFKLPVILSAAEVRRILSAIPALDHRVCLTPIYSCSLRLGERLRFDIDSERMFLHIRAGKATRVTCLWRAHTVCCASSEPSALSLLSGQGHSGQGGARRRACAAPPCRAPGWRLRPVASPSRPMFILCAIPMRRICWNKARTCARSRSTLAIAARW